MGRNLAALWASCALACAPVAALMPTAAQAQANYSYLLMSGGVPANPQAAYPGNYRLSLPSAFNGATVTITQTSGSGTPVATYTYTSTPATPPVLQLYAGDYISASVTGGTPTGYVTVNGGPGSPIVSSGGGGGSGSSIVYGQNGTSAMSATNPFAVTPGTGAVFPNAGLNGTGVASATNPLPVEGYDNSGLNIWGNEADAAWSGSSNGSITAILKGIYAGVTSTAPVATIGTTASGSVPTTANAVPVLIGGTVGGIATGAAQLLGVNPNGQITFSNVGFNALQGGVANSSANPFWFSLSGAGTAGVPTGPVQSIQGPAAAGSAYSATAAPQGVGGWSTVVAGLPASGTFNAWAVSQTGAGYVGILSGGGTVNSGTTGFGGSGSTNLGVDENAITGQVSPTPVVNASSAGYVAKAGTGNLYGWSAAVASGGTAGYIILNNTTTVPAANATLTPLISPQPVAAGATLVQRGSWPVRCSVGCTILFSSSPTTYVAVTAADLGSEVE